MEEINATVVPNDVKPDYEKLYKETLAEKDKLKTAFDKASSEAAENRRKLSEHLTAEENARLEREEAERKKDEELATLREERRLSKYSAKILECGVASDKATELAKMLPDGIPDEFFIGIKAFVAEEATRIKAEALKAQPTLSAGLPAQTQTTDDIKNAQIRSWMGL